MACGGGGVDTAVLVEERDDGGGDAGEDGIGHRAPFWLVVVSVGRGSGLAVEHPRVGFVARHQDDLVDVHV